MPKTATREKPILFSSAMILAILSGKKSITRRVIKPQPDATVLSYYPGGITCGVLEDYETGVRLGYGFEDEDRQWKSLAAPGDRLWVRETWQPARNGDTGEAMAIYKADWESNGSPQGPEGGKWKPSMFMPRWASRITLEVTEVRCERLHEISDADAIAEGIEIDKEQFPCLVPRAAFKELWDSIHNKKASHWYSNPWVFCYTFRRLDDG